MHVTSTVLLKKQLLLKYITRNGRHVTFSVDVNVTSFIVNKIRSPTLVRARGTVGLKGSTTDSKVADEQTIYLQRSPGRWVALIAAVFSVATMIGATKPGLSINSIVETLVRNCKIRELRISVMPEKLIRRPIHQKLRDSQ